MGDLWVHLPTPHLSVQQFLTPNSMTPMPHTPYSPDFTWVTFLVSQMQKALKGKQFVDVEEVKQKTAALKGIKIEEFKDRFE